MKIIGTESYIDLAKPERRGMCQNIQSFQDCLMKDYLERGLEACKCIPLYLRNFDKQVRYPKLYYNLLIWHLLTDHDHYWFKLGLVLYISNILLCRFNFVEFVL